MRPSYFQYGVPTTANAYSAGNVVGGLLPIPYPSGSGQWVLKNLYVIDLANQGAQLMAHFFPSLPAGTYTDQAALSFGTGAAALLVASVEVLAATYKTQNAVSIAETAYSVGGYTDIPATGGGSPLMYVLLTTTGTPTYGAGTHDAPKLILKGSLLRDAN
jgi:hypothetical protein